MNLCHTLADINHTAFTVMLALKSPFLPRNDIASLENFAFVLKIKIYTDGKPMKNSHRSSVTDMGFKFQQCLNFSRKNYSNFIKSECVPETCSIIFRMKRV